MQEEENGDEVPSGADGEEEGELPEQDSDLTPTEVGSHAGIAQQLIKGLAEARGKAPLKNVCQSLYKLMTAQLQDCARNEKLPLEDLQDRVFAWPEGDGSRDSYISEERLA